MGCDIHAVFQTKLGSGWRNVPSLFHEPRHYFLFAWLAGVRNGFGFAGVPTHDPVVPIALPRGLPGDFESDDARCPNCYSDKWLGDHSHSWLTADEILAARRPGDGVMRTGVVERKFIETWDRKSQPSEFCGGISGKDISVATSISTMQPGDTHVRIEWPMPSTELDYFVDEIKRLKDKHGEVRMVFGFDS